MNARWAGQVSGLWSGMLVACLFDTLLMDFQEFSYVRPCFP